jgi:hypothetical protein
VNEVSNQYAMSKVKRNSLLLLSTAGILILVLAMSLPNLVMSPGQPFSLAKSQSEESPAGGSLSGSEIFLWIFRSFVALALIFLPLYLVYSLMTTEGRRRLLLYLVLIGVLLLVADYLHNRPLNQNTQQQEQAMDTPQEWDAESGPETSLPTTPPSWLTLVVILAASISTGALIFVVIRFFQQRVKTPELSLEKLAQEAQNAIESLHAGGDFKATVIQCYQEMSRVVKEEKGIARETAMTAREFEERLVSRGLPQEAIRILTRLFEQARYGSLPTDTRDETLAFSCLTDIVNACQAIGDQHENR